MIFIEDSEKKSPLQKAGATNAFAHFHVPVSRVRWWWRFNLESGGKTAALHIRLASLGVCTRRRRTVGTTGGRCKNREERPGTGFVRRDFRLESIFRFALAELRGRLCRLGRWTWLRRGLRSRASSGGRLVGRRGALCRRRNRGCRPRRIRFWCRAIAGKR